MEQGRRIMGDIPRKLEGRDGVTERSEGGGGIGEDGASGPDKSLSGKAQRGQFR